jgi:hypothetical protein
MKEGFMDWKKTTKQVLLGVGLVVLGYGVTEWMINTFATKSEGANTTQSTAYNLGEALPSKPSEVRSSKVQALNVDPSFKETEWEALVPADWDPMKALKDVDVNSLQDGDPKAQKALNAMKQAWSEAPINAKLSGQKVLIPGFAIPLEQSDHGVSELLLVPYFGACIHTPPPPANQIIHVKLDKPEPAIGAMQPYWVWGTLETQRFKNDLGEAAYHLAATGLKPYDGE